MKVRKRKKPHIVTWEEQEQLLAVAPPRIRVLTVLGVETGMRALRWEDVDFLNGIIKVEKSKRLQE